MPKYDPGDIEKTNVEVDVEGLGIETIHEEVKPKIVIENKDINGVVNTINVFVGPEDGPFALLEITTHMDSKRAHLFHLKVPKELRRQGIGTFLVKVFIQYVKEVGYDKISGRITDGNTEKFLDSVGFNEEYLHVIYVKPLEHDSVFIGPEGDIEMAKKTDSTEFNDKATGVKVGKALEVTNNG